MIQHGPLIATIVAALVLAFAFGTLAHRLKIPPLVGYLVAGVVVGPFTPGYVADRHLAAELAEIGVILLMFGVGLHFSFRDLLSVKSISVPGAIAQIAVATALGMALAWALGWPASGGLVFGLSLSVASTVVLLRALQERRILDTQRGRIAVGWLIVEDLAMVLALVLVPAIAGAAGEAGGARGWAVEIGVTLGKVLAFAALMLLAGRRVLPWMLHHVAHTGSRELFRLAVLAAALGVAYGAAIVFDVSFALGAFFAGMVLSESHLSQRAAEESLPMRDAFAVLFFVSVGMLFDPSIVLREPGSLIATLAIIVLGKSAAAFLIVRAFRHPISTALTISAALAQIGEFSFILAGLGVGMGLMPEAGQDLILASALLSIVLNPVLFALIDRFSPAPALPATAGQGMAEGTGERDSVPTALLGHAVVVGHGRVGSLVAAGLHRQLTPVLVIEEGEGPAEAARAAGFETLTGNGADPELLGAANLAGASCLFVCIPESFDAGQIVQQAREDNPGLEIVARAHSDEEVERLSKLGATLTIMGEREIAGRMLEAAFKRSPVSSASQVAS